MNRNSSKTIVISGLIIVALTTALFFLLTDADARLRVDWWGFGFMLFAEIAATLGILLLHNANPACRPVLMAGGVTALTIYAIASVVTALAFMRMFRQSYKGLIAIEILFAAVVAILILVLWSNAKRIAEANTAVMYSVTAMGGLVSRAEALYLKHSAASYGKSLERLYEGLRYCDNTVMTQADQQIHQQLFDLESVLANPADAEAVERQVGVLMDALQQRRGEASQAKRGMI